jgi:hypothetical protein
MLTLKIFNTPVKIKPFVLGNLVALWAGAAWYGLYSHPGRSLLSGILIGFFAMVLLLVADFGHAFAHILSARYGRAPMDEVLIAAGMPRTLYFNNQVSPKAHRTRALGGPIYSLLGLLLSLLVFSLFPGGSIGRELAAWSVLGQGFIFGGSLLPLPIVDGGTILKWSLVEHGRKEAAADGIVRHVNWVLMALTIVVSFSFLNGKMWVAGVISLGVGIVALGAAVGKIKG